MDWIKRVTGAVVFHFPKCTDGRWNGSQNA